ncbi:hypothetical protein BZA05DRAFT_26922 [Tricharina praecox]|uniref:uncharacterized protein n=1 Tax=Tricharina praecox TaxID=43433 RepID=UPI0022211DA7|nr:uncharacterized protein BZA05DRAFT_26922 [Tricharina praecox]KAI5853371.1 hypothetical protein BZA05DRAFT_26922 [Tricharina praecox]
MLAGPTNRYFGNHHPDSSATISLRAGCNLRKRLTKPSPCSVSSSPCSVSSPPCSVSSSPCSVSSSPCSVSSSPCSVSSSPCSVSSSSSSSSSMSALSVPHRSSKSFPPSLIPPCSMQPPIHPSTPSINQSIHSSIHSLGSESARSTPVFVRSLSLARFGLAPRHTSLLVPPAHPLASWLAGLAGWLGLLFEQILNALFSVRLDQSASHHKISSAHGGRSASSVSCCVRCGWDWLVEFAILPSPPLTSLPSLSPRSPLALPPPICRLQHPGHINEMSQLAGFFHPCPPLPSPPQPATSATL